MKVVNLPIEMIAWFTEAGTISPVKFRFMGQDKQNNTVKVDRTITISLEKLAGNRMMVFQCQSIIDAVERKYELKYELDTCKWVLFKI